MPDAFLTTRRGFVDSISLVRYDYLDWVVADKTKRDKLKYWLEKKSGFPLFDIEDTCFFTFSKLVDESTNQYRINGLKQISAPFNNTQLISNLIATGAYNILVGILTLVKSIGYLTFPIHK